MFPAIVTGDPSLAEKRIAQLADWLLHPALKSAWRIMLQDIFVNSPELRLEVEENFNDYFDKYGLLADLLAGWSELAELTATKGTQESVSDTATANCDMLVNTICDRADRSEAMLVRKIRRSLKSQWTVAINDCSDLMSFTGSSDSRSFFKARRSRLQHLRKLLDVPSNNDDKSHKES
jgi:hypothetical protein